MTQSIQKQSVAFPPIETECHFVQIRSEMLGADAMPRTDNAALQERECGLHGVGCDHESIFPADVFFRAVVHSLALRYLGLGKTRRIQDGFVSYDHVHVLADMFFHYFADSFRGSLFYVDELQCAIALDDTDYDRLIFASGFVAASKSPTADVGFINFDCAIQHLVDFSHGVADTM